MIKTNLIYSFLIFNSMEGKNKNEEIHSMRGFFKKSSNGLMNHYLYTKTMNVLWEKKLYLIIIFLSLSIHSKSQSGLMLTLGTPINQKIEQNGIEYSTKYSPTIDITGFGFGEDSYFGWGGSICVSILDIRNLPERIENKNRCSPWGFYTGPSLRFWIPRYSDSPSLVINGQIGYSLVNLGTVKDSTPWGDFSIKTSVDMIFNKFSIGASYRPLELLIVKETHSFNSYGAANFSTSTPFTLKPTFEVRVSVFFNFGDN